MNTGESWWATFVLWLLLWAGIAGFAVFLFSGGQP